MLRPATPLTILLFAAFILLLISVISVPIVKGIRLATYEGVDFGVFGYCKGKTCSKVTIGYTTDGLFAKNTDWSLPSSARHSLSSILIVHPVAAFMTLVLLVLSATAHMHSPSHSPRYLLVLLVLTVPTLLLALLAFLVDLLLFVPHVQWGGWLVLAATILIAASGIITCAMRRTLVSRKARKRRIAENAEMNGDNFRQRMGDNLPPPAPPSFTQVKPPMVNGAPGADKLPEFATFTSDVSKNSDGVSNDERIPLNSRTPTNRSGTGGPYDAPDRYGSPPGMGPSPGPGRGRGYGPPRDEYGNPMPDPRLRQQYSNGTLGSLNSGGPPPLGGRGRGYLPNGRGGYGRGGPGGFRGGPPPPGMNGGGRGMGMGPIVAGAGAGMMMGGPMGRGGQRGPPPGYSNGPGGRGGPYGGDPSAGQPYAAGYGRRPSPGPPSAPGYRNPSPGAPNDALAYDMYGRRDPSSGPPVGPGGFQDRSAPPPLPGQAIEMDAATGSPYHPPAGFNQLRDSDGDVAGMVDLQQGRLPVRHASGMSDDESHYSTPGEYVPPRAAWAAGERGQTPPLAPLNTAQATGATAGSPIELPTARSNTSPSGPQRTGPGDNYYEDVDPRFAESDPAPVADFPPSLTPGPGPSYGQHLAQPRSYEDFNDGNRSPAASTSSHFTSVSQRGVNPNWRPVPGPGGQSVTPRRPLPPPQQRDILLGGNPDFELTAGKGAGPPRGGRMPGQIPGMGGPGRYPGPADI